MIVTINDVNLNVEKISAAGKPYTAHEVVYTNGDGKTLTKLVFPTDVIAGAITTLAPGDNVEITLKKEGKYYTWLTLTKTDKKPEVYSGNKKFNAGGSKFDSQGAKVGNISNGAVAIYAAKLTPDLVSAVDMVLQAHAYIEEKLKGPTTTTTAKVVQPTATVAEAETWDIANEGEAF